MSLARVRRLADAVLLEGYVLYPYRASSAKNRWRFPFGVLAPRAWSEAGGCEASWLEAQCLVEATRGDSAPRVRGSLRFLQARRRTVRRELPGRPSTGSGLAEGFWDEGEERELELAADAREGGLEAGFELPGGVEEEPARDEGGAVVGQVVRRRTALRGRVVSRLERVPADRPLWRLTVRAENLTPWSEPGAPRDAVLPASCLAAHLILGAEEGTFLSVQDPPPWAREAAARCRSTRAFPVLVGGEGDRDLVLAAPIILYDHPRLAPESPGDFFDATEIDELLALRTSTLTEAEKREARATDPRAAAVLDRVAALDGEGMGRLHGTFRDLAGAQMVPRQRTGEAAAPAPGATPGEGEGAGRFRPGDRVRLRPGVRRTDAQDLLYAGQVATVREVKRDVDDQEWLAVTVDGDPAAELHDWYGRYQYYHLDEVEPLEPPEPPRP